MPRLTRSLTVSFQPQGARRLGMRARVQPQRAKPQRPSYANPRRKRRR